MIARGATLGVVLSLGLVGLSAWVAQRYTVTVLDRQARELLAARHASVDNSTANIGRDLEARIDLLMAEETSGASRASVERLRQGGAAAYAEAAALGARHGIELLSVVSEDGTIVSSRHWPERAGLPDPDLLGLPVGVARLRRIGTPEGSRLAVVTRVELPVGGLSFIAGALVGSPWLEPLAGDGFAVLLDEDRTSVIRIMHVGHDAVDIDAVLNGSTVDAPFEVGRWLASWRPLLADESNLRLYLATSREAAIDIRERLRWVFTVLAAAAAFVGGLFGAWLGNRVRRPVRRLVAAVDAVAAGQADYGFRYGSTDDLDELATSFSRLKRSLDLQQQRSAAAERVAAWQEIARHVAHEVKNPLAPIRLTVENLVRARERDPDRFAAMFEDGARTILEEVEQLRRLVNEFSEFARLPAPRPEEADLHELLDGVVDLFGAEPDLEVVRDYASDLLPVRLDPDQINRALKNVVGNAVEAMHQSNPPSDRGHRLDVRTAREDNMARIEIRDSGPGLGEEVSGRIFEPYFTTKGHGTGLGMAIVHRIVTEHGGLISAENVAGGGARITIRLPLAIASGGEATP